MHAVAIWECEENQHEYWRCTLLRGLAQGCTNGEKLILSGASANSATFALRIFGLYFTTGYIEVAGSLATCASERSRPISQVKYVDEIVSQKHGMFCLIDISMVGDKVHLPPVLFQPMSADDVASGVARVAVDQPINGVVEIAGPEQFRVDELVRRRLASLKDPRQVIADPNARYGGAKVSEKTLLPANNARLSTTRFETWLTQSAATGVAA